MPARSRSPHAVNNLTLSSRAPGVAQVTMSRPAVFNAFDEAMIAERETAFTRLAATLQWMQRASTASREWNLDCLR